MNWYLCWVDPPEGKPQERRWCRAKCPVDVVRRMADRLCNWGHRHATISVLTPTAGVYDRDERVSRYLISFERIPAKIQRSPP